MSFWNPNEPLGLPKGSVTALLAIFLVFPLALAMVVYTFAANDIPPSVKDIMLVLVGVAGKVISDYIYSRKNGNGEKPEEAKPTEGV
jgi:hypothetical protein